MGIPFTRPASTVTYRWDIRSQPIDGSTPWTDWDNIPTITTAAGGAIPLPLANTVYEIRIRSIIAPRANALLSCIANVDEVLLFSSNAVTLKARVQAVSNQNSANQNTLHLICSPNPATEQTSISYSLEEDATVTMEILDALQRVVLRPIIQENRQAGAYLLSVPVTTLPSGMYSVRMSVQPIAGMPIRQVLPLLINR